MTPKEKAKDLIEEFATVNRGNRYFMEKYNNGITGARLCVKEVLIAVEGKFEDYWKQVLKEINEH